MARAFIGSSTEAYIPFVVPFHLALTQALDDAKMDVQVVTWKDQSRTQAGKSVLQFLDSELGAADFGIFFFTKDDEATIRDITHSIPRDNVVFEAGMSVARLGTESTIVLVEKGARRPSDFSGYINHEFATTNLAAHFSAIAQGLVENWKKGPLGKSRLRTLGFDKTLSGARERLSVAEEQINKKSAGELTSPIVFSAESCVDVYEEALQLVQNRFWTTTFFSSGFWRARSGTVLQANEQMLLRLRGANASVRRIFVLPTTLKRFLNLEREKIASLVRTASEEGIQELEHDLTQIRSYIRKLKFAGCEVKVGFDQNNAAWQLLTDELRRGGHREDTELAIFDDLRIDMYGGGKSGNITRVSSFPNTFEAFAAHLDSAQKYFSTLWDVAHEAEEAIDQWWQTIERGKLRIDYRLNWISKYDHVLPATEVKLKSNELAAVVDVLKAQGIFGKVASYLDVGTCTARYPIALSQCHALAPGAIVDAIDEDRDCVEYCRSKVADLTPAIEHEINFIEEDFLRPSDGLPSDRRYDLITCMLGTISHFGGPAPNQRRQRIGSAIEKMRDLLKPGGIAIIGNWSESARRSGQFLSIYRQEDQTRLSQWTATAKELTGMIAAESLELRTTRLVSPSIDIFVCVAK